jgi:ABC-type ATPase with predicted acetyltransferase domain
MLVHIDQSISMSESYAAARTMGLYNVGVEDGCRFRLDVDVPVEREDWQIGVVVGPSGSGKTSIAKAIEEHGWKEWVVRWPREKPIIEVLASKGEDPEQAYAKATASLAAVGLGSVPSWLRPHSVLSNGEGFRADLALLLRGKLNRIYIDEFTSVLDRQVAKVGAGAFAKAWRKAGDRQIILITPHYDVLEWIEPDWWIDTAEGLDEFASDRGVVKARKGSFQEARDRARYPGDEVGTLGC